jgi:hypothetical protein
LGLVTREDKTPPNKIQKRNTKHKHLISNIPDTLTPDMGAELQVAETRTPKPEIQDSGLGCLGLGVWDIACGSWDMRFLNAYHIHILHAMLFCIS